MHISSANAQKIKLLKQIVIPAVIHDFYDWGHHSIAFYYYYLPCSSFHTIIVFCKLDNLFNYLTVSAAAVLYISISIKMTEQLMFITYCLVLLKRLNILNDSKLREFFCSNAQ